MQRSRPLLWHCGLRAFHSRVLHGVDLETKRRKLDRRPLHLPLRRDAGSACVSFSRVEQRVGTPHVARCS